MGVYSTQEEVIKQFKEIHGNKYDYSKVKYINNKTKVEIICPTHGSFWMTPNKHKAGQNCSYCSGKQVHINDSIGKVRPDLIKYFANKEEPFTVLSRSNKKINAKCPKCGYEKRVVVEKLNSNGFNCNNCKSFENNYPHLITYLKNKKDGKLPKSSHKKIECFCPDCGFEKKMSLNVLSGNGFYCDRCSDGISVPEKFMINLLEFLNFKFEPQYTPLWSNGKRYDFYIPSLNCIIEMHGRQHYENVGGIFRSLEYQKNNDIFKQNIAITNGISKYRYKQIDCRKSEKEWLITQCKNNLSDLFELNSIDWDKIWSNSQKSKIKEACQIWDNRNQSETTSSLCKKLKIGKNTLIRYLKLGDDLGWCCYNPKEEVSKNTLKNNQKKNKPVLQYTKDGYFIKEFISATIAKKETGICHIGACCNEKRKTAGGYVWKYKKTKRNP